MKELKISVTEAARNFADCVNRAHYQDVTFVLLKNGKPIARLVREGGKRYTGRQLADILSSTELSPSEARKWHRERKAAHKSLSAPVDKWK